MSHYRFIFFFYLFFAIIAFFPSLANHPIIQKLVRTIPLSTSYKNPILVTATAGLDAKLIVAQKLQKHEAIGFDLVAHCINELVAQGVQPLFFAHHFAAAQLNDATIQSLINGMRAGCTQSNCVYGGSESSEIKKLFNDAYYDISGFAVGIAENNCLLPQSTTICPGDVIIGLPTLSIDAASFSPLQSLIDYYNMDLSAQAPFVTNYSTLADALLVSPTIYTHALLPLCQQQKVKAMALVTKGGLYDAIHRILPPEIHAKIEFYRWTIPPCIRWIKQISNFTTVQMAQIFNLGIGMVLIVAPHNAKNILTELHEKKINATSIGTLEPRSNNATPITLLGTIGSSRSRVLIIGNSTQEHPYAWKLAQSPFIETVFVTPGNGGTVTEKKVHNLLVNPAHYGALIAYTQHNNIDLVIITDPKLLAQGIVDEFHHQGIRCIGPTKDVVQFLNSAQFLQRYPPMVQNSEEPTISFTIITDGDAVIPLTSCQQYKRRYDNDNGPDTNGMGACSPAPIMTPSLQHRIMQEIIEPALHELKKEGLSFCGFLTAHMIITSNTNPQLVSFDFNLGGNEAATLLMRLQTDFFTLCYTACHHELHHLQIVWDTQSSLTVELSTNDTAAKSPPSMIVGISDEQNTPTKIFHRNTLYKDGKYFTKSMQPIFITALGQTLETARNNAYKVVHQIYWPYIEYRHDIGYKEIAHLDH